MAKIIREIEGRVVERHLKKSQPTGKTKAGRDKKGRNYGEAKIISGWDVSRVLFFGVDYNDFRSRVSVGDVICCRCRGSSEGNFFACIELISINGEPTRRVILAKKHGSYANYEKEVREKKRKDKSEKGLADLINHHPDLMANLLKNNKGEGNENN